MTVCDVTGHKDSRVAFDVLYCSRSIGKMVGSFCERCGLIRRGRLYDLSKREPAHIESLDPSEYTFSHQNAGVYVIQLNLVGLNKVKEELRVRDDRVFINQAWRMSIWLSSLKQGIR